MKQITAIALVFLLSAPISLYCQKSPAIEWQRCLGGTLNDNPGLSKSIIQTSDGGYAVCGSTGSSDGDVSGLHSFSYFPDMWVVKLDAHGVIQWQKCLGGTDRDGGTGIIQTSDGGFVIAGNTNSYDGDVSGNHGKDPVSGASFDEWVVKLDSTGKMLWQRCYGAIGIDEASSIIQTTAGDIVIAGYTESTSEGFFNHGLGDAYIIKLNSSGDLIWQKCYGGSNFDEADCIIQTSDKGFAFAGYTYSDDGDVSGVHTGGSADYWVVKLDSIGNLQWQKCLGGTLYDVAHSIIQTREGGFVVAGIAYSNDGDVSGNHGLDAWVIALDSVGGIQWQKCLGGSGDEWANSIIQTAEGGFMIAGHTGSIDGDVIGLHQGVLSKNPDAWIVKLSSSGTIQWQKCLGGTGYDEATSILQTTDGGYAINGIADTNNDGDIFGNHGGKDIWVVKLSAASSSVSDQLDFSHLSLSTYPNPATSFITLSYDLPKSSAVEITISNVTGEQMQKIQRSQKESGHNEETLDLSRYSEGTYFISISACGMTERVMVQVVK